MTRHFIKRLYDFIVASKNCLIVLHLCVGFLHLPCALLFRLGVERDAELKIDRMISPSMLSLK